ncbi:sensor histidine kinase [Sphingomonas sp. ID0503]|uniref:sensor histidine kinase n=1 Tax=Sphingomonas sp. ID0503 TaxID=3399691 RepID=UPI003AFB6113
MTLVAPVDAGLPRPHVRRVPLAGAASREGSRQAMWMTLGLWGFTYLTFLMPSLADDGRIAWYGFPIVAAAVGVGLILSDPLYLLMRAMRETFLPVRILVAGLAAAVAAALHAVLDAIIVNALRGVFAPETVRAVTAAILVDKFLAYIWIYELYVIALGLIFSVARANQHDQLLLQAQANADQARLTALRFQINPHFLFNTLNSISSLVVTDRPEEAELMIDRLAEFLRASLSSESQEMVPLGEELATIDAYIEIETVRFGDRLGYEVDCPPGLSEVMVPSFILQPLVENAVKYAVAASPAGATIRVSAWREDGTLRIAIVDDGLGVPEHREGYASTGLGVDNVRERLVAVFGKEATLATRKLDPGFEALLCMPVAF